MKNIALLFSFLIIIQYNYSQCNGRYQDEIFSSVSVNTVNYSDVYTDFRHEMDIYTPDGDTETNRPPPNLRYYYFLQQKDRCCS